jgi:uncharacterized membrane protein
MKADESVEPSWHPETDPARLLALSDGIFSVAMTLAVIQVMPTDLAARLRAEGTAKLLVELLPEFAAVTTTFFIVGIYWITHHRIFSYIRRTDRPFLFLNLLFLLDVTLMPFFVLISSAHESDAAGVVAYAVYVAVLGLVLDWIWGYASKRHRLIDPEVDARVIRYNHYRSWITSLIFLASCPVALYVNPGLARFVWILVFFNGRIASFLARRRA